MLFGTRFGRHGSHVRSSAFELILVSIAFACGGAAASFSPLLPFLPCSFPPPSSYLTRPSVSFALPKVPLDGEVTINFQIEDDLERGRGRD